jgi:hypothetical protein
MEPLQVVLCGVLLVCSLGLYLSMDTHSGVVAKHLVDTLFLGMNQFRLISSASAGCNMPVIRVCAGPTCHGLEPQLLQMHEGELHGMRTIGES